MAQTAVIIIIDNEPYEEVWTSIPDREEMISIVKDIYDIENIEEGTEFEVEYEWYEIGEGESGTDYFFIDEDIIRMYNSDIPFEDELAKRGYNTEMIQCGSETFIREDFDEEE